MFLDRVCGRSAAIIEAAGAAKKKKDCPLPGILQPGVTQVKLDTMLDGDGFCRFEAKERNR